MQPAGYDGNGVLNWFSEEDRKLAMGMCDDGLGIYADTLRARSGDVWAANTR